MDTPYQVCVVLIFSKAICTMEECLVYSSQVGTLVLGVLETKSSEITNNQDGIIFEGKNGRGYLNQSKILE
jgi:hypothetical protein